MDFSSTVLRQFRFKDENRLEASLFLSELKRSGLNFSTLKLKKGLPQYKGQVKTGWSVFVKARTVYDEISAMEKYSYVSVVFKQPILWAGGN